MSFAQFDSDLRPGDDTPWGTHVPRFYRPHRDESLPVTKDGIPLGFTVGDVAADRRWAIGEDGELIDQLAFMRQLRAVWDEQHQRAGGGPTSFDGSYVPRVEKYVAWTQDKGFPNRLAPLTLPKSDASRAKPDATPIIDAKSLAAQGFVLVRAPEVARSTATAEAAPPPDPAERKARAWTEEERRAAGERLKAAREAKKAATEAAPAAE